MIDPLPLSPAQLEEAVLPQARFALPAVDLAPALLGKLLVRRDGGAWMAGLIVETEAYQGESDLGCHARAGRTPRTAVMYGPPGRAYVYFTYGMHWLLNAVCDAPGTPAAVLLRAIRPVSGSQEMEMRRPRPRTGGWLDGPAKLCQALAVDGALNGCSLADPASGLWIADPGTRIDPGAVCRTPRIGLERVPEPWRSIPWRFVLEGTGLPA